MSELETVPRGNPPPAPHEKGGWDLEVQLADLPKPLDPNHLFGRTAPFEIEIGFGSGIFLCEEAMRRPGVNFLAIEKDGKQVKRAKDKWRRRNLLNVRALRCDAFYFLEEYIPDQSVGGYFILFSDPWFKKRHHKRRVFSPRLLPILERTMTSGAHLHVKTDISPYYDVIRELLLGATFLRCLADRRLDLEPQPDDIVTNYQRKALEKGHPIHEIILRRV